MGIRRGAEVDALLDQAEQRGSCLYTSEKWATEVLRGRVRKGTVLEIDTDCFVRWCTWRRLDAITRYRWRMSAVAGAVPGCVFCRESAAVLHGLFVSYANLRRIHVATSRKAHTRSSKLVERQIIEGDTFVQVGGFTVTSLFRTSFDCMRSYGFPDALAIADSTVAIGGDRASLEDYVEVMPRYHGVNMARRAVMFADPRAENGGESVARAAMIELGYAIPDLQHPIVDSLSGKEYRADFYWELADGTKIAGELDGDQKYTNPAFMGGRTLTEVLLDERKRESRITKEVNRVCRFSLDDVRDRQYFVRLLDDFGIPRNMDDALIFR